MEYNTQDFVSKLEAMGITLTDEQVQQFITYYEMLVEKNKVMNLTGITEFDEVLEKHFEDSLSLIRVVDLNQNFKIMDLGTGAGFPGIPLKIAFPNLKITLADSLNKRILFLQDVIDELQLKDIAAIHGRAEDLARNIVYREQYDLCVSRAVANLSTLAEYCLPFVKIGGQFVSYKSGECDEEVKELLYMHKKEPMPTSFANTNSRACLGWKLLIQQKTLPTTTRKWRNMQMIMHPS